MQQLTDKEIDGTEADKQNTKEDKNLAGDTSCSLQQWSRTILDGTQQANPTGSLFREVKMPKAFNNLNFMNQDKTSLLHLAL